MSKKYTAKGLDQNQHLEIDPLEMQSSTSVFMNGFTDGSRDESLDDVYEWKEVFEKEGVES